MKKIKYLLFIILCNIFMMKVHAASASVSVSPSSKNVQVGQTFTVNVSVSSKESLGSWQFNVGYDSNVLQYVSSNLESGLSAVGFVSNSGTRNKNYRLTFKAKKEGTGSISVNNIEVYSFDEELLSTSRATTSIKVSNPSSKSNKSSDDSKDKSADNYLSSLSVEGYDISPKFSKNETSYTLTVPNSVEEVKINAKARDDKAHVSGDGKVKVKEGTNRIYITVTAENSNKKTYGVKVIVQEKDPIKVTVDGEEYTVAQKLDGDAPTTYVDSTVLISGSEVPAYKSDISNFTLVGLISKDGNQDLYIYDSDTYTKYKEYKFNGVILYVKKPSELPKGASEDSILVDGDNIAAYKIKDNAYPLIYGMNVETGEDNFYTYESSENTLQKYVVGNKSGSTDVTRVTNSISSVANDDKFESLAYILCGLTGMLFIFLAISAVKISIQKENKIQD